MAKDVKCVVSNCQYYSAGDSCQANVIEVCTDKKCCDCSSETNCKTFRPRWFFSKRDCSDAISFRLSACYSKSKKLSRIFMFTLEIR